MLRHVMMLLGVAVLAGGCVTNSRFSRMQAVPPPAPADAHLRWEVENRDRLLKGPDEEDRFHKHLASYIEEYRAWFRKEKHAGPFPNILNSDLLHEDRSVQGLPENFRVNYDPRTQSYRCGPEPGPACAGALDWLADDRRTVRLSFGADPHAACAWEVAGLASTEPCGGKPIAVRLDLKTPVRVRRVSDGAADEIEVRVRDLKIVALGDSFSAGEGNPHDQWRYYFRWRKHPAQWLDARCHRSLMSAPSLTAAYLAQNNPHISVTLLHYGCSGASVADGLVTPWSLLETADDIRHQYAVFGIRGPAFDEQGVAREIGRYDVPPTQIEQAEADLTVDGKRLRPDVVLLSVGGNDIGFAGVITGLVAPSQAPRDMTAHIKDGVDQVVDYRPYASFDDAEWVKVAQAAPCDPRASHLECMHQKVMERLVGADPPPHQTLLSQYDALAHRLETLTQNAPGRVFISHYPNFVMREPDRQDPATATWSQAIGCVDRPLDGRAGFIPGLFALIPGLGMREHVAEQAERYFLAPLDNAISGLEPKYGWTVVSTHVHNGRTHGYCSLQRYYNTLADSYWNQGRRYQGPRPLGNFTARVAMPRFDVAPDTKVYFDARRDCYALFANGPGDCLKDSTPGEPVQELKRDAPDGAPLKDIVDRHGSLLTSGPVHPNLFGHCNYASAIVTRMLRSPELDGFDLDPDFRRKVAASGPDGLKAEDVCQAKVWGYELRGE